MIVIGKREEGAEKSVPLSDKPARKRAASKAAPEGGKTEAEVSDSPEVETGSEG